MNCKNKESSTIITPYKHLNLCKSSSHYNANEIKIPLMVKVQQNWNQFEQKEVKA
jgi:hypothetical protein